MRRIIRAILVLSLLPGCQSGGPDMGPIGGGLSVIGLALVVAAFVGAIFGKGGRHDD